MRVHVVLWTVALVMVFAVTAVAADVSGKWVAQVPGRQGNTQETTFTFKVSGATLTGLVSNQRGDQEISEGKISGDDIAFVVVRKFNEMEMKTAYKGKVTGSEIKFTSQMQMPAGADMGGRGPQPPAEFVAKRAQ